MEVLQAKSAGFCWGVRRAVDKAFETASVSSKQCAVCSDAVNRSPLTAHGPVFTDGPLIHNPEMIRLLEARGVHVTTHPEQLPEGATLILRAHGIPPERRHALQALPIHLVDATCPEVARIQGMIRIHVEKGFQIVIHGDKGHAEVVGLCGYAQGKGCVVETVGDVQTLPRDWHDVCLVAQSTQDLDDYHRVTEALRSMYPSAVILDTICDATKSRQSELKALAAKCDAMVVVGSATSANSRRLAEIAAQYRPTFLVGSVADLHAKDFTAIRTVGLTAGASTPDDTIATIRDWLQRI